MFGVREPTFTFKFGNISKESNKFFINFCELSLKKSKFRDNV